MGITLKKNAEVSFKSISLSVTYSTLFHYQHIKRIEAWSRLPTRSIKIDIRDGEGNKITVSFQGGLTRNKVLQLLEFVELLDGVPSTWHEDGEDLSDPIKV